jgi:acyl carrier protein
MTFSDQDLELFAARIRAHFDPELRQTAYQLALGIARCVGEKSKLLRPETTLAELFSWFDNVGPFASSLDQVEWIMAVEEELGFEIPDKLAGTAEVSTFRDLVIQRARKERAA